MLPFIIVALWSVMPGPATKVLLVAAAAVLLVYNVTSMLYLVRNYRRDKDFIYRRDVAHLRELRRRPPAGADRGSGMSTRSAPATTGGDYVPPKQGTRGQLFDSVFILVLLFAVLFGVTYYSNAADSPHHVSGEAVWRSCRSRLWSAASTSGRSTRGSWTSRASTTR